MSIPFGFHTFRIVNIHGDDSGPIYPSSNQQRMAYLFPIGGDGPREYVCVHCSEKHSRVFSCTQCDRTICIDCVRREEHRHLDRDGGPELKKIGEMMGPISRTRVAQIMAKALRKIRISIWRDDLELKRQLEEEYFFREMRRKSLRAVTELERQLIEEKEAKEALGGRFLDAPEEDYSNYRSPDEAWES